MMKNQSRSKEEGSQEDEGGYDSDIARQLQERHAKLVQGKRPNRNDVKPVNLKAKTNIYNPPARIKKDKESFANFRKNQTAKVSFDMIGQNHLIMSIMRKKAGIVEETQEEKRPEKMQAGAFNPSKPFGNKGSTKKHARGNRFIEFTRSND